jgi:TRAP-type mannitol/chloroaromatic compound transport system permease small subunit
MHGLLVASDAIDRTLMRIATAVGWLFILLTAIILFDVLTRKFGFQLPYFGSTRLQELEWHVHTALFTFWLGAGYVSNTHVRIDLLVTMARPRTQALVELLGCLLFALPYCLLAGYFSFDFTLIAFVDGEASPSSNGLPYRWIPKAFITMGLVLLLAGVLSVMMRTVVFLFGPERLRASSGFAGYGSAR